MKEVPHRAIDSCVEWEDRAQLLVDEEDLALEAMKIYLAAMEDDSDDGI